MSIFIAVILIMISFYLFFLVTQKNASKTHRFADLSKHVLKARIVCYLLLLISLFLLCQKFGAGIGCVSFFVIMSPVIFVIILSVNNLKQKNKKA